MFFTKERLRKETRSGAIVVVGITHPVGIELESAVVEVKDRRIVEITISIWIICFCPPIFTKF